MSCTRVAHFTLQQFTAMIITKRKKKQTHKNTHTQTHTNKQTNKHKQHKHKQTKTNKNKQKTENSLNYQGKLKWILNQLDRRRYCLFLHKSLVAFRIMTRNGAARQITRKAKECSTGGEGPVSLFCILKSVTSPLVAPVLFASKLSLY